MMKISYINHSGFLIETKTAIYIFDYFKGMLPHFDSSKPVTVFSSHGHHDHYNPDIFKILRFSGAGNVIGVLSDDIPKEKLPPDTDMLVVHGGRDYTLPRGEKVQTFFSTDEGVAFLLETDEGVIFHAGDLNDWRWEGESDQYNHEMKTKFRNEIEKLRGRFIDHAFVPLDPRQEGYCGAGLLYFLENVRADNVYPMHYWDKPDCICAFTACHPEFDEIIRDTENL